MKIKDVNVGGHFLCRLMLGAGVYVHAQYKRGVSSTRPGYFDCQLLTLEVLQDNLTLVQKLIVGPEHGLTMNGEVEIWHEEIV